jgi:NADH:ubiquinone oxidoreductase subunit 5 (subunit L)/multisubunit Na+/H+ antiporter MnhA subunit
VEFGVEGEGMSIFICVLLANIVCAFISYGLVFAFFQKEYPKQAEESEDECRVVATKAFVVALVGGVFAVCLILGLLGCKHGLKYKG